MKVVAVGCFEPGSRLLDELDGRPAVVLLGDIEEIRQCGALIYQEVELMPRAGKNPARRIMAEDAAPNESDPEVKR